MRKKKNKVNFYYCSVMLLNMTYKIQRKTKKH